MVRPIIRKGNKINQTNGNINNIIMASGQHTTKSIKKRAKAINVFIVVGWILFFLSQNTGQNEIAPKSENIGIGINVRFRLCTVE